MPYYLLSPEAVESTPWTSFEVFEDYIVEAPVQFSDTESLDEVTLSLSTPVKLCSPYFAPVFKQLVKLLKGRVFEPVLNAATIASFLGMFCELSILEYEPGEDYLKRKKSKLTLVLGSPVYKNVPEKNVILITPGIVELAESSESLNQLIRLLTSICLLSGKELPKPKRQSITAQQISKHINIDAEIANRVSELNTKIGIKRAVTVGEFFAPVLCGISTALTLRLNGVSARTDDIKSLEEEYNTNLVNDLEKYLPEGFITLPLKKEIVTFYKDSIECKSGTLSNVHIIIRFGLGDVVVRSSTLDPWIPLKLSSLYLNNLSDLAKIKESFIDISSIDKAIADKIAVYKYGSVVAIIQRYLEML
jgi:hypothetical protein